MMGAGAGSGRSWGDIPFSARQSSLPLGAPAAAGSSPSLAVNLHGLPVDHQAFRSSLVLTFLPSGSFRVEELG